MEKLIQTRIINKVKITECQGGGKKGVGTRDHLLILNSIIRNFRRGKKTLHVIFLDVEKAFDKAWRDGIMNILNKRGCDLKNWIYLDKLNDKSTVKIKTKWGLTKDINTDKVLKQGSVMSPIQYGILIDEIAKELYNNKKGIILQECNIPCLLWVDDIAVMKDNYNELQEMMDIVYNISQKYRIKYGLSKSKHHIIGDDNNPKKNIKLGDNILEKIPTYKYLGITYNRKGNLDDHIKVIDQNVMNAIYSILDVVSDKVLDKVELKTIWILIQNTITSIICYGLESFKLLKKEYNKLTIIHLNAIKTILNIPNNSASYIIYSETEIPNITHTLKKRKILYYKSLLKYENRPITINAMESNDLWLKKVKEDMKEYNIEENDLITKSKDVIKKDINIKIKEIMIKDIMEEGKKKSKVQKYIEQCNINEENIYERKDYLINLTKFDAKYIFMGRSGQFPCKTNHKWDNIASLKCRWCLTRKEDEQHILRKCRKCPISNRPINFNFFGQRCMTEWHDLSNLYMEYNNILNKRNEKR